MYAGLFLRANEPVVAELVAKQAAEIRDARVADDEYVEASKRRKVTAAESRSECCADHGDL
jgi:hypothetical protein